MASGISKTKLSLLDAGDWSSIAVHGNGAHPNRNQKRRMEMVTIIFGSMDVPLVTKCVNDWKEKDKVKTVLGHDRNNLLKFRGQENQNYKMASLAERHIAFTNNMKRLRRYTGMTKYKCFLLG